MKKIFWIVIIFAILAVIFGFRSVLHGERAEKAGEESIEPRSTVLALSVYPEIILQGEPAKIAVEHLPGTTTVTSITFNQKSLGIFEEERGVSALVGIDLKMKSGAYPVKAVLSDGTVLEKDLVVGERIVATAPLGIPDSLGGNTSKGEATLNAALAKENALLANISTEPQALWEGEFRLPVENPFVTDTYGYTRLTGASTISHKGTDYRAEVGTPIYAANAGIVRIAREFIAYGNAVVIDHGLGVQTPYMHLSELNVKEGERIEKGHVIGKSGDTGYVQGPHLHLSVKIGGISIDPEKFFEIF